MANAIIALNIVAHHRQKASDDARLQRAKDIIATGHANGQTLWQSTPREYDRLAMNDHMRHALAQMKCIAAAAQAEAELVAGDLLERERVRDDEIRRQNRLVVERESIARHARF